LSFSPLIIYGWQARHKPKNPDKSIGSGVSSLSLTGSLRNPIFSFKYTTRDTKFQKEKSRLNAFEAAFFKDRAFARLGHAVYSGYSPGRLHL
jgi:hypothetical protein